LQRPPEPKDQPRHKNVVMGLITTNAARDARPGRRI
jgi:hypothetical protein